jgi:hypothetical protein
MKHYIIAFSGYSGVGKDECSGQLVRSYNAIHTGLADPGKRHMADTYGWTEEQLFGPSHFRNVGDMKYPKFEEIPPGVEEGDPKYYLSPREALQKYMGLMNDLYPNTWIQKGVYIHHQLGIGDCLYTRMGGLKISYSVIKRNEPGKIFTTFSDFRHKNEISYLRKHGPDSPAKVETIPIIVRVKRPSIPNPPYDHRSEVEQSTIPDSEFDFVINNDSTLEELYRKVDGIVSSL